MTVRHHYVLDLEDSGRIHLLWADEYEVRHPAADDLRALSELMLEAYRGTIDYDGEGIDEAVAEVEGYLSGSPILDASTLALVDGEIASACLVAEYEGEALIGYVMTAPEHKRKGLGRAVTAASLAHLQRLGHDTVHAWITEGNEPSERIFRRLGFSIVD